MLAIAAIALHLSSTTTATTNIDDTERTFALTESGGLSRGAYDAGVTWAMLRVLAATHRERRPKILDDIPRARLAVLTGASSGALNTFLAALSWCDDVERSTAPEHDILYRTWMKVSWAALFPPAAKNGTWRDDDGLLTRAAYDPIIDELQSELARTDRTRVPDGTCPVTVATTLAPVDVEELRLEGKIAVKTQRFVTILDATTVDGQLSFANGKSAPAAAPVWHLGAHDAVSFDDIRALTEAGTAFPLSFSPRVVDGWIDGDPHAHLEHRRFLDGGLFDNLPLDLATALVAPPATLITIDPERRRGPGDVDLFHVRDENARGAGIGLALFGDFLDVARDSEMQKLARNFDARDRLLVADRSSAIVGETMLWFGAFLYEQFRRYDFYAGIYDGLVAMAHDVCTQHDDDTAACTTATTAALLDEGVVNLSPAASWVVHTLMCVETNACVAVPAPADPESRLLPMIVAASTEIYDEERHGLADVIDSDGDGIVDARDCPVIERMADGKCVLARLIEKMKQRGALAALSLPANAAPWQKRELDVARAIFTDWDGFVRGQSFALLRRAEDVERSDADAGVRGANDRRRALVVVGEALRTWDALSGDRTLLYLPSTVPLDDWPVHFVVPTRAGVAPLAGDVELGWDLVGVHPPLHFAPDAIVDAGTRIGRVTRVFAGAGVREPLPWLPIALEARWHASDAFFSRATSPSFSFTDVEVGALFVDKVRIAIDVNDIANAVTAHGAPAVVVTLGLNDVSGLLYSAAQLP